MGMNFRQSLITELERRSQEIDSTLWILRRIKRRVPEDVQADQEERPSRHSAGRAADLFSASGQASSVSKNPLLYREILDMRANGLSLRAIAQQVRLSHTGVWKLLRRVEQRQPASER